MAAVTGWQAQRFHSEADIQDALVQLRNYIDGGKLTMRADRDMCSPPQPIGFVFAAQPIGFVFAPQPIGFVFAAQPIEVKKDRWRGNSVMVGDHPNCPNCHSASLRQRYVWNSRRIIINDMFGIVAE